MFAKRETPAPILRTLLLVFVCFTLTSYGFLAWLYHLMQLDGAGNVEAITTGGGYACQAVGLGLAAALLCWRPRAMQRPTLIAAVVAHLACALAAGTSGAPGMAIAFGFLMSLLCGFVAAFYLAALASHVPKQRRGLVFGGGYALSTAVTWLFAMAHGALPALGVSYELIWSAVFSAIAVIIVVRMDGLLPAASAQASETDAAERQPKLQLQRGMIALACIAVVLMSLMKGLSGGFPSADIGASVSLETTRLLYAVGLIGAGLVIDRNRTYGAVLCMAALIVPFAILALSSQPIPAAVLWAIDYLLFGFFSVFRVVLFADLAAESQRLELSGLGLLFGRIGDALGTFALLALGANYIALVVEAAALFIATAFALARLTQQLYAAPPDPHADSTRQFDDFSRRYNLSRRECDMLRLVLERRTNPEIAEELVLSENTVKFHMRNLLKKTSCKNRAELIEQYENQPK